MQDSLLFKQFSVLFLKPHAVFKLFSECFVGQHVGDDVDIMRGNSRLQLFWVGGFVTDVEEGNFFVGDYTKNIASDEPHTII